MQVESSLELRILCQGIARLLVHLMHFDAQQADRRRAEKLMFRFIYVVAYNGKWGMASNVVALVLVTRLQNNSTNQRVSKTSNTFPDHGSASHKNHSPVL